MTSHLIDSLATTDALAEIFADDAVLQAMLDVEAALARVLAQLDLIPATAAESISQAARAAGFDAAAIARDARTSGTVVIPLIKALTDRVGSADPESARYVHWGLTSQDVMDTACVLVLRRARALLDADTTRLTSGLRALSDRHAHTVMLGRTLLQPAPPITFGLKVAGWYAAARRSAARLSQSFDAALIAQCGGASGTLAALGEKGLIVAARLAVELKLTPASTSWHTQRDRLAAVVSNSGILVGSLGKMARDISLLMQHEIGEVAEPGGGSSAMPAKRNPAASAIVLAAATRTPGLVAAFLSGMVHEHERSVGGWHAEWPTIASTIQLTGAALAAAADLAQGLTVDADRMRANIAATRGTVFGERLMMLLAPTLGRAGAHQLAGDAVERCQRTGRSLSDVARDMPEITAVVSLDHLRHLDVPQDYLGAAEQLRIRLLESA